MNHSRRYFLKAAAGAAAGFSTMPLLGADPDHKYRTALIGSGWWGKTILKEAMKSGRVKVVALCDADTNTVEVAADQVNDLSGNQPKTYKDYRELLDKEKPEIAIIASPDHWHSLQTIAALQAGAHVYVEKPTGHTVNESRAMVHAARDSGRVVQVGLHRRIGPHHLSGMKFLKSGAVGEVGMVRLFADSAGGKESPKPNSVPPDGLDWNLWCGPAPLRPFNNNIHPGGWRQYLDYGNGQLGDWGVHWLDQVLWWSEEKYPHKIYSTGGRAIRGAPVLNEREQTSDAPDHQVAVYEFAAFTCTWEHHLFAGNNAEKHQIGAYYYGAKGTLHVGWRDGWTFYPTNKRDKVVHEDAQLQEPEGHNIALLWADFLDAIQNKKKAVANIETAHRSSVLALLGMVSWRAGRSLNWDGTKEQITGDEAANKLLSRQYRAPWIYPV